MLTIDRGMAVPGLRFDHLVVAAPDLEEAGRLYEALGFEVRRGGRHTGWGTHNALVRFRGEYLELLSVYSEEEAERGGRSALVHLLRTCGGGLAAYCLAAGDLDALAERLRAQGFPFRGPFPMERLRPDGRRLTWRLLVPLPTQYRHRWPFFIRWDLSDEERAALEGEGRHPNGAQGVMEVAVVVRDLEEAARFGRDALGLGEPAVEEAADLGARGLAFALEGCRLLFLSPTGPGPAADALRGLGEGPVHAVLRVRDLQATRRWFAERGRPVRETPRGLLLEPASVQGVRLLFREG